MGRPPLISRAQMIEAARAVFVQRGFQAATLAEIAGRLGVTPAAVLRRCGSKQKLFAMAMEGGPIELPAIITELASVDPRADPRQVLRKLAEQFIPVVQATIGANLAVYMHGRSQTSFVIPFDTSSRDTPPRKGLRIVGDYFRRASEAGLMNVQDPRAAALLFMGSLHSYVFLHQILHVSERPFPLTVWIDQLIEIWTGGAIVPGGSSGQPKVSPHQTPRSRGSAGSRRGRGPSVAEGEASPGRATGIGNDRSANRERGVALRRPRRSRPRR